MSCGNCHCSPCSCDDVCDPNNEPLASALNNFISSFFGTVGKTCVDNQVQWILPCDLNTGLPGFERRQGEGVACYLLRLFEYLNSLNAGIIISDEGVVIADPATQIDFVGDGVSATAAGGVVTVTITQPPAPSCAAFFDKIAINGECYDTWQAAYDANASAAVPTLMLVGQGSTFGNLVLTGNYNSNIIISGFGSSISQLGTISGAGFTVNLTAYGVTLGNITSSGAAVTISGKGASLGSITTTNGAGTGGAISIPDGTPASTLSSNGTTGGGNITLGEECHTSSLDSRATVSGDAGHVVLGDRCEITGSITTSGIQNGGDITTGVNCLISGNLDLSSTTNTSIAGICTLGRQTSCGNITGTAGWDGDFVTLGAECTVGAIVTSSTGGGGTSGPVVAGDDCVIASIDVSTTAVGTGANAVTLGDRCEVGAINAFGQTTGGGVVTIGNDCVTGAIDCRGVAAGPGGSLTIGRRCFVNGTANCSGATNGGAISIGSNTTISSTLSGAGASGTSGPVVIEAGGSFGSMVVTSTTSTGLITIGKFCIVGSISGSSTGTTAGITIGDGCTIGGAVSITGTTAGAVTIGNAVTITGDVLATCTTGTSGGITTGSGCNLQMLRCFKTIGNAGAVGNITLGAGSTSTELHAGTSGGVGSTAGSVTMKSGSVTGDIWAASFAAGSNSGNVVLEPGAVCNSIHTYSSTGTGGSVTLRGANIINGSSGLSIETGTSNTGTILSFGSHIKDQIDNVNGSSIFRDLIGSTPAANRDFIANLTAIGSQYTNCLIVPHGTGVSINASAPRTVIAYQFLQKNAFPANVTLSEGSETTSPNLLAP